MKKIVLITGANGMLANELSRELHTDYTIRFLTRKANSNDEYLWDISRNYIDPKAFEGVNYIIHLAGASIAEKKWSEQRKKTIVSSRVDSAQLILDSLKRRNQTIDGFISASAVGYYGAITNDNIFDEEYEKGNDFLSETCEQWENQAHKFTSTSIAKRIAIVRIGIILSKKGGALDKIIPPIKYGIGSGLGNGNQYMPWIHIQDLSGIFKFILENKQINGIFNAVSEEHITNNELTQEIATALNRKIILPNVPSFVLKLIFGKMSVILLEGSRVSSEKIRKAGYQFKYKTIKQALNNLLKN